MTTTRIYKIKHKVFGQYSKGGTYVSDRISSINHKTGENRYVHWSKKGKVWQGTGPIRCHLNQYVGWKYGKLPDGKTDWNDKKLVNDIPDTWIVEEHLPSENVTYQYLAKDFYENRQKPVRI